nr:ABC transporter permease [Xanthovirga aplysinae]
MKTNLLRTILSLLGVTVGIFSIIAVFTVIDSLKANIKDSMAFLGDNVIKVEKWPLEMVPEYPWWKYFKHPHPNYTDYEFLAENLKNHKGITISAIKTGLTLKFKNNSISGTYLEGFSHNYNDVFEVPIEKGRYFTYQEISNGTNVTLIGAEIAESLFLNEDPVGKTIKIKGIKYMVVGVLEKQGEGVLDTDIDLLSYIPYKSFKKIFVTDPWWGRGSSIAIKGKEEDVGLRELEGEITGLMRRKRGLRPNQENNFAINRSEFFANIVNSIFGTLTLAGWVIGGFSILVGGFGIANIMFVSVKERTNIIGIQKSLGAKNYFVLNQFLFEAIFLSLIGGGVGIFIVYLLSFISLGSLNIVLTFQNILIGLGVSCVVGIASGIIPAYMAAKLDPVIAIRTN